MAMKAKDKLTYEVASKYFYYDTLNGKLYWKWRDPEDEFVKAQMTTKGVKIFNTCNAGKQIGTVYSNRAGNNYLTFSLKLNGKSNNYSVHRVIWLIMNGSWPEELDHIDGNGLNNNYRNMRDVNRSGNSRNHRLASNNKVTGVAGVRFYSHTKVPLWQAYCYDGVERKQIQLGNYKDFFEAICARKSYELLNGYSERHGR